MRSISTALITAPLICLLAVPAHALRANTYVASYGTDSGTCSFSAPCRTFTYALSQVQAGGVVTAVDSAGNSPFVIEKAVTIMAPPGVSPSIQASPHGTAIYINAQPSDIVVLRGLILEGENSAATGINFISGAQLEIYDCVVHAFTDDGINVEPSTQASVVISNTTVTGMTSLPGNGILLNGLSGGTITATLDHIISNNNQFGVGIGADTASIEALIKDSSIDNDFVGISIVGCGNGGNGAAGLVLKNVSVNQSPNPIFVDRCSNTWMSHVVQTLAPPLPYNPGVIFNTHNTVHVFSDGTNLTSAPPNSFEPWGIQ